MRVVFVQCEENKGKSNVESAHILKLNVAENIAAKWNKLQIPCKDCNYYSVCADFEKPHDKVVNQ